MGTREKVAVTGATGRVGRHVVEVLEERGCILRAAQFHEFVEHLVDWGRQDGVSYVPRMRTQLIAARAVADGLADLTTGSDDALAPGSSGAPIPEIAGPREESLVEGCRFARLPPR